MYIGIAIHKHYLQLISYTESDEHVYCKFQLYYHFFNAFLDPQTPTLRLTSETKFLLLGSLSSMHSSLSFPTTNCRRYSIQAFNFKNFYSA